MKSGTVLEAFYNVLRAYNMTTVFGNPGSTEQPMLTDFPSDFSYILGLQEATVVGMADGYAQATNNPTLVQLHSAGGTGNGMGNIINAYLNKSPLVIFAGQQTTDMIIGDPLLTNRNPTVLPEPYIKWAYQPSTPQEVPAALVRAISIATMPPAGPVYLVVPLDYWNITIDTDTAIRTVSTAFAADPSRLAEFASRISSAKNVALVYGEEVDKSGGWAAGITLAEMLKAPVYEAPLQARAVFPFNNPLYRGPLAIGQGPVAEQLAPYDMVLVVGAEVFRYYPWAPGPVLEPGTELLQITNSPHDAGSARIGDSLLSDSRLALEGLITLLSNTTATNRTRKRSTPSTSNTTTPTTSTSASASTSSLMSAADAFAAVAKGRQTSDLLVQESPSNVGALLTAWPIVQQQTYFTSSSDYLGWGLPASVGIAIAQTNRTTIAVIGDGSLEYSIQSIYSAVQHKAKVIFLVPQNNEYAILKEFAIYQDTPGCPGMNLPGLDAVKLAEGYGCPAIRVSTTQDLAAAFENARHADGPVLIEFLINPALQPLPV